MEDEGVSSGHREEREEQMGMKATNPESVDLGK